jgi:rSAM/selenodomain-associated transferase 1
MIFAKIPEAGKVKTRLAETVGEDKALQIYLKLLARTHDVASKADADKLIFYTGASDDFDMLDYYRIPKTTQCEGDLGARMKDAFTRAFAQQYEQVIIIGSDCYELSTEIIDDAFSQLSSNDFAIGPAKDGGYYLLGMTRMQASFFEGKTWSTEDVFLDTILDMKEDGGSYAILPTLSDVDKEADLPDDLIEVIKGFSSDS